MRDARIPPSSAFQQLPLALIAVLSRALSLWLAGRSLASAEVIERMGQGIYKAGRRLHGSWQKALEAVSQQMVVQALAGRQATRR